MIAYINSHPEDFDEAVDLAVSNKQPYAWKAAWLLWSCVKENDDRIIKHIDRIISALKVRNDNQKRELLKILLMMNLNKKQEGVLFNICSDIWEKTSNKPSVRFIAFKFIVKIAEKHPDLKKEINFLTQSQYMECLSAVVQRSIYRMIKY